MFPAIDRSIRLRVMFLMVATTFAALLFTAVTLVLYDLSTYKRAWIDDLVTQANLVGRASAPAVAFLDPETAEKNLSLLAVRPQILSAAIYTRQGIPFARYFREGEKVSPIPARPGRDGYRIDHGRVILSQGIYDATGRVGTIYLEARYELTRRLWSYLAIIGLVMVASLLIAFATSYRLQAAVTAPLLAITDVSNQVKARRDYSLRVRKTTRDEIGELVDTFNDMLEEVGQRTAALEQTNRSLQHEMTIRRDAELALRAADQRKDEFLATLSHELRNPLAPIRNALEILRQRPDDPRATEKAREIMDRQLRQLVRLVDDLLDVSRITTGKLKLRKERVVLRSILENTLDVARPALEARGVRFSLSLPAEPIHMDADPARLSQAFLNLLDNAAKFTPSGGSVSLTAEVTDGSLVATVTDTGIGMPSHMVHSVFEMFAQIDHSIDRPFSGLGVGLSLARRFIELHGGTLEGASDGVGHGSRFVVRLPVVHAGRAGAPASERDRNPGEKAG